MKRLTNWIDGAPTPPLENKYYERLSLARSEASFEVPLSGAMDVVQAVRAAHKGLKDWSRLADRTAVLERARARLIENAAELSLLVAEDSGRPLRSVSADITDVLRSLANFTRAAPFVARELSGSRAQAVGVIAVLTSWRNPLVDLLKRVYPALAFGNALVIKPSRYAPRAAFRLGEILAEAKLPAGAYNVVNGAADPAGQFLTQHPGVARVAFCGKSALGAKVLGQVAVSLKPAHLELSRKNTIIVLKDAELNKITTLLARAAVDGYAKILVQDELYPALSGALAKELGGLRIGAVGDAASEVGTLITIAHQAEFTSAVATAKREDGRVLFESADTCGPVLIGELTNCSEIHQTEIAGPLITLNTFKYVTDAVKWANNTPYGGAVSVWTKNLVSAQKLAAELDFGAVTFNGFLGAGETYNGIKSSGVGKLSEFFCASKSISFA